MAQTLLPFSHPTLPSQNGNGGKMLSTTGNVPQWVTTPWILSSTIVNGKVVGNTPLFTVPTGKVAVITGYVVRVSAATSITLGPVLGIGNIAGTSNIAAALTLTVLTTLTSCFGGVISGATLTTAAGGIVYCNVATAALGTSQTLTIDLIGYLV